MNLCPVCAAALRSPVCTCGFDESCRFEAYPTLASVPTGTPSIPQRKAEWEAKHITITRCPHCGEPVTDSSKGALCHYCELPVRPDDIVPLHCLHFDSYLIATNSAAHRKLLAHAEAIMRYFEYIDASVFHYHEVSLQMNAQHYADTFACLAEDTNSFRVVLTEQEKGEFRNIAADAAHLIKIGFRPGMSLTEETRYKFQSSIMIQRVTGRYPKNASADFDLDDYLRHTESLLFMAAHGAFLKKDYSRALSLFLAAEKNGNIYASARIGIMYHYGYGCEIDRALARHHFSKGSYNGCPLGRAWISEYVSQQNETVRFGDKDDDNALTLSGREAAGKLYAETEPYLKLMCDTGDMEALFFRGYNLLHGVGIEQNVKEGFRLLSLALQNGEHRAAVHLAECYYNGWGVVQNYNTAFRFLTEHPQPGFKKALFLQGKCYYYGHGTDQDYPLAIYYFRRAAKLGHGSSKDYLGDCYYNGYGTAVNYPEAAKWYKDAADNHSNGNSAMRLAGMYRAGKGVEQNLQKTKHYYLLAAQEDIVPAQRLVSLMYLAGSDGFEQDNEAARLWMEKAAQQGDAESQFRLGQFYLSDLGFDDDKLAFEWFIKAAEQGYPEAEHAVGCCYAYNLYVDTDYYEANSWFQRASDHGVAQASYELGLSYLYGRGVTQYGRTAIHFLKLAADGNVVNAKLELAKLYIQRQESLSDAYKLLSDILFDENIEKETEAEALYWCSVCLKNGYGCTKNNKNAKQLYKQALERGYVDTAKKKGLFDRHSNK